VTRIVSRITIEEFVKLAEKLSFLIAISVVSKIFQTAKSSAMTDFPAQNVLQALIF
jgi:hypothetical protein